MGKMFVANCTVQVQEFHYRTVENPKVLKQIIEIGGQIQLSGDLTGPDITGIIAQHAPYGMVHVSEIDRAREFVGVCYSIDKPVDMERVRYVLDHNNGVLDARGKIIRQEAAIVIEDTLSASLDPRLGRLKAVELELVEDEHKDRADTSVNEIITVDRTDQSARGPSASPVNRPRKRAGR